MKLETYMKKHKPDDVVSGYDIKIENGPTVRLYKNSFRDFLNNEEYFRDVVQEMGYKWDDSILVKISSDEWSVYSYRFEEPVEYVEISKKNGDIIFFMNLAYDYGIVMKRGIPFGCIDKEENIYKYKRSKMNNFWEKVEYLIMESFERMHKTEENARKRGYHKLYHPNINYKEIQQNLIFQDVFSEGAYKYFGHLMKTNIFVIRFFYYPHTPKKIVEYVYNNRKYGHISLDPYYKDRWCKKLVDGTRMR